ncbi:MAG TPA: hypothetical protein VH682_04880 [Gemmataceae bacterium]|jgi:hypothetical protein
MPNETLQWLGRIKSVEKEYNATRFATDRLLAETRGDPGILKAAVEIGHITNASKRLEGTYIIRLFAEFETGLKAFLRSTKTKIPGKAEKLLDRVASKVRMPDELLKNAHAVRAYRNLLVHDREEELTPIAIRKATSHLCTFFGRLPMTW